MTDPLLPVGDGHTELDPDDRLGLIPTYIATRGDLYDAEQRNIAQATLRRTPRADQLLDDQYLRSLHAAMFGKVWTWAGKYRQRETTIGVDPVEISTAVRLLVDDAKAWIAFETYSIDELTLRFHHRLVAIHPFVNGNGRHGRISSDYLVVSLGGAPYTWGANLGVDTETLRTRYLTALRAADLGEVDELLGFARS